MNSRPVEAVDDFDPARVVMDRQVLTVLREQGFFAKKHLLDLGADRGLLQLGDLVPSPWYTGVVMAAPEDSPFALEVLRRVHPGYRLLRDSPLHLFATKATRRWFDRAVCLGAAWNLVGRPVVAAQALSALLVHGGRLALVVASPRLMGTQGLTPSGLAVLLKPWFCRMKAVGLRGPLSRMVPRWAPMRWHEMAARWDSGRWAPHRYDFLLFTAERT